MEMIADINRGSPEPFYLQLGRWLEEQIESGQFGAGDQLPTESELCRQFSLSRSTVRESLRSLQERGKIKIIQRRGAFVCGPAQPGWMVQSAEGFFESEADFHRRAVETEVLQVEHAPLPQLASDALNLPEGSTGVVIERLRRLDGTLALYGINYLIPSLAPVIGDGSQLAGKASLNRVLRAAGWHVHGARRSLSAVAAPGKIAAHLGIRQGDPLMLIRSVSWDARETAFDYHASWIRSEEVPVAIEVQVESPAQRRP
jgi:GntR family transcriptional regulator